MFIFILVLTALINCSVFSCTPPDREYSLASSPVVVSLTTVTKVSVTTTTQSPPSPARFYNSLLEDETMPLTFLTPAKKRSELEKIKKEEAAALEQAKQEADEKARKQAEEERQITAISTKNYFFEWPGSSAPIQIIKPAFYLWAKRSNDSTCP
ncbi:hypothetical protein BH09DEP1_BH09DEP1_5400 [soil metagenome]